MTPNNKSKFIIPRSQFHIGQRVLVRCEEIELGPNFEATIYRIDAKPMNGRGVEYAVVEDSGMMSDGYDDSWLTPIPTPNNPQPSLEKMADNPNANKGPWDWASECKAEMLRLGLLHAQHEMTAYTCVAKYLTMATEWAKFNAAKSAVASSEAEIERLKRNIVVIQGYLREADVRLQEFRDKLTISDGNATFWKSEHDRITGMHLDASSKIELLQSEIRTMKGQTL